MVKKVLLLSNTATLGTNYGYKVVQYMLKIIKPVSTQIHKKVKKSLFFLPNIALTSASRLCTARNTDATTSTRMIHFSVGHKPLRQHVTQRLVTTEHHGHDSNRCVNNRNRMHTQTNPFPTRSLEPDWESQTDEVLFETCCLQGHLSWFISHNKNFKKSSISAVLIAKMHGATWTQTGQSQKISLGEQVVHIKPSLDQSAFYY